MKTITLYYASLCNDCGNPINTIFAYHGMKCLDCGVSPKSAVESFGEYNNIGEYNMVIIDIYSIEVDVEDIIRPNQEYDIEVDHDSWLNGILLIPFDKYINKMKDIGKFNLVNIGYNPVLNLYMYRCYKCGLTSISDDDDFHPIQNIYDFYFIGPVSRSDNHYFE